MSTGRYRDAAGQPVHYFCLQLKAPASTLAAVPRDDATAEQRSLETTP